MKIREIIYEFEKLGVKTNPGASKEQIEQLEKHIDYKFPITFIEFYSDLNGFKDGVWNKNMFSLFSLERIKEEYGDSKNEIFIPFCDYLHNSHQIGFCKEGDGIYIDYNVFLRDYNDKVSDSFEQSLIEILKNSEKIY